MNVLVIFAHPGTDGHNTILRDEVLKILKRKKSIHTTFIDLYKEHFNPVLAPKEHYTARNKFLSKETKHYQLLIKEADKLVFIYPVWWGSMPAILKGFFDRVLTSPFSFQYEKKTVLGKSFSKPVPKLIGKRAVVLNTTGAPEFLDRATLRFPSLLITRAILGFTGIKAKAFTTNDCKRCDAKKKRQLKNNAKDAMNWLLKN